MKLIIVESPTKARTIAGFLPKDFTVESSMGHVRDLPKSKIGVDFENNFAPHYVIPAKARGQVKKLKDLAKKSSRVILATDEDREGEAIAWHLISALSLKDQPGDKIERIVFHEITPGAIKEALSHPRDLDLKLVDAQQARRILDRIVGYKLSPFLWKKVSRGLSAGRVQSVTTRLIAEREREIERFKSEEYWTIDTEVETAKQERFHASLSKIDGKNVEKFQIKNEEEAKKIVAASKKEQWVVAGIEKKASSRSPFPPFTTSTLQQEASRRFGFSARQTMMLAQQLYEGISTGQGQVGLITYMRTDSVNMAQSAVAEAREFITQTFGEKYRATAARFFKTKSKSAQEAHEAIRPTAASRAPENLKAFLEPRQLKLYSLIWQRFVATQMPEAVFDQTRIDIGAGLYTFHASGQVMKFDGFLKVYPVKTTDAALPDVASGERVTPLSVDGTKHFTEPPPRYTDASLIKTLESRGIGRPSTYAPTLFTVQARGYVEKIDRRYYKPTEIGMTVNDLLVEHFPEIVDMEFTAKMEAELDEIAEGEKEWQPVIQEFYEPFAKRLETKYEEVKKQNTDEATDEVCEKCGKPMVIRRGRFGKFLACSGFPECKNTKRLPSASLNLKCLKCHEGEVIERNTKRGKLFYGCSRWPECDFATWQKPTGEACPECGSPSVLGKNDTVVCSSKSCGYKGKKLE